MATLLNETFTGTGAWPSASWDVVDAYGGASSSIVDNRGRTIASVSGGYGDRVEMGVKESIVPATSSNYDITGTITVRTAGEFYPHICFRGLNRAGYTVNFQGGDGNAINLQRAGNDAIGFGGSGLPAMTLNEPRHFEIQALGDIIRIRMWLPSETKPTTWAREFVDPNPITSGRISFGNGGGFSAISGGAIVDWDDIVITSGVSTPVEQGLSYYRLRSGEWKAMA